MPRIENARDGFALIACHRIDLASHFAKADECNVHASSLRTSLSYRSTPSRSSRLLIFSPAVCASRIDPGPISSRLPALLKWGAVLPKETTVLANRSTTSIIHATHAPTTLIL